jgi:anti-sigma B factor antagonist
MQADFSAKDSTGLLTLTGDLNAAQVDDLRQKFKDWYQANSGLKNVVVDLGQVGMVDSAGLGVLIAFLKQVSERQGELRLADIQKRVRMVFEITRTNRLFDIFDSVDEAVLAAE